MLIEEHKAAWKSEWNCSTAAKLKKRLSVNYHRLWVHCYDPELKLQSVERQHKTITMKYEVHKI
jgi:hypothetical protein